MADPVKPAAPAPQAQPQPQTGTPVQQSLAAQGGPAASQPSSDGLRGPTNPNPTAMGAKPTPKFQGRSSLVQNPTPTPIEGVDEPVPANMPEEGVPESTRLEMEAGKKALERNQPTQERADAVRSDNDPQKPAS